MNFDTKRYASCSVDVTSNDDGTWRATIAQPETDRRAVLSGVGDGLSSLTLVDGANRKSVDVEIPDGISQHDIDLNIWFFLNLPHGKIENDAECIHSRAKRIISGPGEFSWVGEVDDKVLKPSVHVAYSDDGGMARFAVACEEVEISFDQLDEFCRRWQEYRAGSGSLEPSP